MLPRHQDSFRGRPLLAAAAGQGTQIASMPCNDAWLAAMIDNTV
jgi:hypothetical protein